MGDSAATAASPIALARFSHLGQVDSYLEREDKGALFPAGVKHLAREKGSSA